MPLGAIDDYLWLTGAEGAEWIARASRCGESLLAQVTNLRKELSPGRAHLVVELAELRKRALAKFSRAEQMFFTRVGLEQSTDESIATYKTSRFPAGPVVDLCCGIGGDLMALATRGPTMGVERDPCVAALARANVAPVEQSRAAVVCAAAETVDLVDARAWHIDPDRREAGRRTTRVEQFSPALADLNRMLAANNSAAVKLAPASVAPDAWREDAELEWISRDGECRQQVAWFGALAEHASRKRATIVGAGGRVLASVIESDAPPLEVAGRVDRYLFEPDAAVIASRLIPTLAARHGLSAIEPGVAYLTGDSPIADAALDAFEVLDCMKYNARSLKRWLRDRGIGHVEVKKRGVPLDPAEVQRALAGDGQARGVVILARVRGSVQAIVARRIAAPTGD